jgi:hypothetical protein
MGLKFHVKVRYYHASEYRELFIIRSEEYFRITSDQDMHNHIVQAVKREAGIPDNEEVRELKIGKPWNAKTGFIERRVCSRDYDEEHDRTVYFFELVDCLWGRPIHEIKSGKIPLLDQEGTRNAFREYLGEITKEDMENKEFHKTSADETPQELLESYEKNFLNKLKDPGSWANFRKSFPEMWPWYLVGTSLVILVVLLGIQSF